MGIIRMGNTGWGSHCCVICILYFNFQIESNIAISVFFCCVTGWVRVRGVRLREFTLYILSYNRMYTYSPDSYYLHTTAYIRFLRLQIHSSSIKTHAPRSRLFALYA